MSDPQPERPEEGRPTPTLAARAGRPAILLVRIAGDALVVDAAYETWRSGSPMRAIVVLATVAFVALTAWVLSQGGRIGGRGWLTDPAAPFIFLLGLFVAATGSRENTAHGIGMLGQRGDAVLVAALLVLVALAVCRLVGPGGVRSWWLRLPLTALGAYAGWSLALSLGERVPFVAMIAGNSAWRTAPVWLRGASVGAFVLLPLAFVRELGVAMARLTTAGLLRWMFIFALGVWMAARAASL